MNRKAFLTSIMGFFGSFFLNSTFAEDFPSKPIKILLGFGAGGSSDQFTRDFSRLLALKLGKPVVVENKPGAATTISTTFLFNAPADGYTLSIVSSHFASTPKLYPNLPYDVTTDFTHIALQVAIPFILVVNPNLKVNTLQEFITLIKSQPGKYSYGSTGTGGVVHLATERFKQVAGIDIAHIPYKSDIDALLSLIRGDVSFQFGAPSTCLPHIRSGAVKALAWSGIARSAAFTDVPTIAESGYLGFSTFAWFGFIGPPKIPKVIVDRLAKESQAIMSSSEMQAKIINQGMVPISDTMTDKFTGFIKSETEKWGSIISSTGVKAE